MITLTGIGAGPPWLGLPSLNLNGGGGQTGYEDQVVLDPDLDVYIPDIGGDTNPPPKKGNGNSGGGNFNRTGSVKTGIESGMFACGNPKRNKSILLTQNSGEGVISSSTPIAPTGDFTIEVWTTDCIVPANGCVLFGMAKENVGPASEDIWCALILNNLEYPRLQFIDATDTFQDTQCDAGQLNASNNDNNRVVHIVVTYTKSTGAVEWYINGVHQETDNLGTAGVKAITSEDVRYCIGDVPSAADSDVAAGVWGGTHVRVHDTAYYTRALSRRDVMYHYNLGMTPCDSLHPFNYLASERHPATLWLPFDGDATSSDGLDPATETSTAYVTGGLSGQLGYAQQAVSFNGSASAQLIYDGSALPTAVANDWWTNGTTPRTLIWLNNTPTTPSGSTERLFGTAQAALNNGWDVYSTSASPYNITTRLRNASTEEYFSGGNNSTYGTWHMWAYSYYEQRADAGMYAKNGSWETGTVTNGGSSVSISDADLWIGWLTGATGTGYRGYMQHMLFIDDDLEWCERLDFWQAFIYYLSPFDHIMLNGEPPEHLYLGNNYTSSSSTITCAIQRAHDGSGGNCTRSGTINSGNTFFLDNHYCYAPTASSYFYISGGYADSIDGTSFSAHCWVKTGTAADGDAVMSTWTATGSQQIFKVEIINDSGLKWRLSYDTNPGPVKTFTSTTAVEDNTLYDVWVTYDATDGWAFYVNGAVVGTDATTGRKIASTTVYWNYADGSTSAAHEYQRCSVHNAAASADVIADYYSAAGSAIA